MATYTGRKMSLAATKFVLGDANTEIEKEALRDQIGAIGSASDANTTYTQSLDGTDLTLLGSDASTSIVDLSSLGITYTQSLDGTDLTLTGSDASTSVVDLSSFLDNTDTTYTQSLDGTDLTLTGSDASTSVVDLSSLGGGGVTYTQSLLGNTLTLTGSDASTSVVDLSGVSHFDQDLNTTDSVTFNALGAASASVVGVTNTGALTVVGLTSTDTASVAGLTTTNSLSVVTSASVAGALTAQSVLVNGANIVSSSSIAWNAATNPQPDLTLAHDTTITVSSLPDRGQASLSGIVGGSGEYSVDIGHAGLTLEVMGGALEDIEDLLVGGKFEISIKRNLTELRVWVSTKA